MGRIDSRNGAIATTQAADVDLDVTSQDARKCTEQRATRVDGPTKSRRLPLWRAVKGGSLRDVELVLSLPDVDPNEADRDSRTALWWAAWSSRTVDNVKIAELLLANDRLEINAADKCDQTPLHVASLTGNVEVVKLLLAEAHLEVNIRCYGEPYEGSAPLHVAVDSRNKKMVRLLLTRHDIDVDIADSKGNTPLHLTIAGDQIDGSIARLLLAKDGVNPTRRNRNGRSFLEAAAFFGHADLVDELLSSNSVIKKILRRVCRALAMVAAEQGHVGVLEILCNYSEDLGSANEYQRTPLHSASENGHLDVVELLLGIPGINVHPKDARTHRTPLHCASQNGHLDIVERLLETPKIDIHAKDIKGQTPLFLAACREDTAVEKLFLARDGADDTEQPSHIRALLKYATRTGEGDVVQLLLRGEDGQEMYDNTLDADGHTLMWLAAEKGDMVMMRKLREWDFTTLHSLVNKGEQALVKLLLEANYKPDTKNVYGQTALHLATLQNRLEIAEVLIELKANVDCRDTSKNTSMRLAVERKSYEMINLLLSSSAHVRGLLAKDWIQAFDKKTSHVVLLKEEPSRRQSIEFIDTDIGSAELQRIAATVEVNRRML